MAAIRDEFDQARDARRIQYRRDRAKLDRDQREILDAFESLGRQEEEEHQRRVSSTFVDRAAAWAGVQTYGADTHIDPADVQAFIARAGYERTRLDRLIPMNDRERLVARAVQTVMAMDRQEQIERGELRFLNQRYLLDNLLAGIDMSARRDVGFSL